MKSSKQQRERLRDDYKNRRDMLFVRIAENLERHITECLEGQSRIDRISARAKGVESFVEKAFKAENGEAKYSDPLNQIQDQIGARVVVFYNSDVERIDAEVKKYFRAVEYRHHVPDSESEFGYFGNHLILILPTDVIEPDMDPSLVPQFFELQIKTLFQHAWSEAGHDLGYKSGKLPLTPMQTRLIAFTSAQAWGADQIFEQLFQERAPAT